MLRLWHYSPFEQNIGVVQIMNKGEVNSWLEDFLVDRSRDAVNSIRHVVALAELAGDEYLSQGLAMAEILDALHVDVDTLSAAILYSSVQQHILEIEDIADHVDVKVCNLIKRALQMDGISELYETVAEHDHRHPKVDMIRKMVLAMVNDVRAVLIKLAEQVIKLRSAKKLPEKYLINDIQIFRRYGITVTKLHSMHD